MKKCSKIHVLKYKDVVSTENLRITSAFDYVEIPNELEDMQSIVDGLIEPITICSFIKDNKRYALDLVCNDDGKLRGLPYNAVVLYDENKNLYDYIAGDYFFALCDTSTGEYIDLTNDYVDVLDKCFCCCELSYLDGKIAKVVPLLVCSIIQKEINNM